MRKPRAPRSKSRQKLINAAEKLFAEHGFDTISIRDITSAAKANVAAVNYHFSSREDLVNLVITRNLEPIQVKRESLLTPLEANPTTVANKPIVLLNALLASFISNERSSSLPDPLYFRLLGHIFSLDWNLLPKPLLERNRSLDKRFITLLQTTCPTLSAAEIALRYHFTCGSIAQYLVHHASIANDLPEASRELSDHLDQLTQFAASAFGSPSTPASTPAPAPPAKPAKAPAEPAPEPADQPARSTPPSAEASQAEPDEPPAPDKLVKKKKKREKESPQTFFEF